MKKEEKEGGKKRWKERNNARNACMLGVTNDSTNFHPNSKLFTSPFLSTRSPCFLSSNSVCELTRTTSSRYAIATSVHFRVFAFVVYPIHWSGISTPPYIISTFGLIPTSLRILVFCDNTSCTFSQNPIDVGSLYGGWHTAHSHPSFLSTIWI